MSSEQGVANRGTRAAKYDPVTVSRTPDICSRVLQLLAASGGASSVKLAQADATRPVKTSSDTAVLEQKAAQPMHETKESLAVRRTEHVADDNMIKTAATRLAKILRTGALGRALTGEARKLKLGDAALRRLAEESYFPERYDMLHLMNLPTLRRYENEPSALASYVREMLAPSAKSKIDFGGAAAGAAAAFNQAAKPKRRWFGLGSVVPGTGVGDGKASMTAADAARRYARMISRMDTGESGDYVLGARIMEHRANKLIQRVRARMAEAAAMSHATPGGGGAAQLHVSQMPYGIAAYTKPLDMTLNRVDVSYPSSASRREQAASLFHELLEADTLATARIQMKKQRNRTLSALDLVKSALLGGSAKTTSAMHGGVALPEDLANQWNFTTSHLSPSVPVLEKQVLKGFELPDVGGIFNIRHTQHPLLATMNARVASGKALLDNEMDIATRAHAYLAKNSPVYRDAVNMVKDDVAFAMSPRTRLDLGEGALDRQAAIAELPFHRIYARRRPTNASAHDYLTDRIESMLGGTHRA